jgi:NAD-dependent DNA ligase
LKYVDLGKYNVSRIIDIVKSTAKKHIALRGEIIITKAKYEDKYTKIYPKARSLIAGVVNSKTVDENIAKDMQIVFYELINPSDLKFSVQFSKIADLGFNLALNKTYGNLAEQMLPEILIEFKKKSKYEIDGIILADNTQAHERVKSKNPKYAVAFKMALSDQIATTTIENIEYNISKHGALCPRILYKPVVIKGDTHQYTSGFNLRYIIDNKLGPGAEIQIIKSGDVIPYIYNIIKPAKEPQMPDKSIKWHWNNTEIDAIVDDLETNEDVRTRRIISFFSVMKIAGVGPGNVDKLVNAGYDQIKTILELTPDVIALVDGFQLKSATNVYNSIHKVIDLPQPLERVMAASNIFGIGLGERKFKMIFDKIPNFFNKWTSGKLNRASIMDVEGFSDKTADLFIAGMPKFVDWLKLHSMIKLDSDDVKKADIPKGNKYAGAVIVFTGIRDTALEKEIESQGGKIGSGVTGKTTLLVAKDISENSSKINKANELGIQIVAYDNFVKNK